MSLTIVTYHYVRDFAASRYPGIKGREWRDFQSQLDYIESRYTVVSLPLVLRALSGEESLPANAALLTFDDGYREHVELVYPELKRRGMTGVFFPPVRAVRDHEVLAVNKIHFILAAVTDLSAVLGRIRELLVAPVGGETLESYDEYYARLAVKRGVSDRFDSEEVLFVKRLLQRELPPKTRAVVLNALFAEFVTSDELSFAKELYASVDELRAMLADGMFVGSHGYAHQWMDSLSPAEQEHEVDESVKFLRLLGVDSTRWMLCYPYGATSDSLISILRRHGCVAAVTTVPAVADIPPPDRYRLPRLDTNDVPLR